MSQKYLSKKMFGFYVGNLKVTLPNTNLNLKIMNFKKKKSEVTNYESRFNLAPY